MIAAESKRSAEHAAKVPHNKSLQLTRQLGTPLAKMKSKGSAELPRI